jgi:hypothetical protein
MITVDTIAPILDLNITFENCICPSSAKFTFEPNTYGDCPPLDCCYDECSGVDGWTIEDGALCPVCPTITGTGCPDGIYDCGCLLYPTDWADEGDNVDYLLEFTFTDNVGNEIVDTWTITVDSDSVVGFANTNAAVVDFDEGAGTVNIPYSTCEE